MYTCTSQLSKQRVCLEVGFSLFGVFMNIEFLKGARVPFLEFIESPFFFSYEHIILSH